MPLANKLINYFKESRLELKKVIWPTKKQTLQYTLIVVGFSLGLAAALGALDYLFASFIEKIINR